MQIELGGLYRLVTREQSFEPLNFHALCFLWHSCAHWKHLNKKGGVMFDSADQAKWNRTTKRAPYDRGGLLVAARLLEWGPTQTYLSLSPPPMILWWLCDTVRGQYKKPPTFLSNGILLWCQDKKKRKENNKCLWMMGSIWSPATAGTHTHTHIYVVKPKTFRSS